MFNFLLCKPCYREHSPGNTNIELNSNKSFKNTEIPLKVKAGNIKPMTSPTSITINQNRNTSKKKLEEEELSEFNIIDYPYSNRLPSKKLDSNPDKDNTDLPNKIFAYVKQRNLQNPKIAINENNLDNTLIDDISDAELNKNNHSIQRSINNKNKNYNEENKCCIYCEEVYKEAYQNGDIIQEKLCIYCNRMINQKTFDELYSEEKTKENQLKINLIPLEKRKAKSTESFKKNKRNDNLKESGQFGSNSRSHKNIKTKLKYSIEGNKSFLKNSKLSSDRQKGKRTISRKGSSINCSVKKKTSKIK